MPSKHNIKGRKGLKSKKQQVRYTINCSTPVEDEIMEVGALEDFLRSHIKVDGKAGNLGSDVQLGKEKSTISVTSEINLSKRYLKYLTKKFLKKNQLRDYVRVVSCNKTGYELRYLHINVAEEESDDEEN